SERVLGLFIGYQGLVLSAEEEAWPSSRLAPAAFPENLAYVVYTSGSTGRPKGVLATHGGAASYLRFLQEAYGLGPADRVLQLPALTFDASVRDLLGSLAAGAAVVLVDMEQAKDPAALLETMERRRVTRLLSVVPTMLRGLLEGPPAAAGALRQVLVSGERLYLADCARARELFGPELSIVNQYGPTECTMTSSYHPVGEGSAGRAEALLGRPIPNSRFCVLEESGVPVPLGSFGELHIGGVGLARGYLGRPDLTAAAFRPDPFSGIPGARLYATGDLVRHLADGSLELRGRRDHQVKLRGFRVELGEIEQVLLECPGVRSAAVTVREGRSLVAHVVPGLDVATLRSELESRLPAYMVPSSFQFLERLPVTPHGKVDRKALESSERTYGVPVAPRTPMEEMVAGLFAEVLKVERVGASDSFFDLGGHSLLATRLTSRIQAVCGVELPVRSVFESPTVADLAACLEQADGSFRLPPIEPVPRRGRLPLSFAQQRFWFLYRMDPESPVYNVPLCLRLRGELRVEALAASLGETARRHEAIRTTFDEFEGEPVQVIAPAGAVPLPVIDLAGLPGPARESEVRRLAAEESRRPFDLVRGPVLRASLVVLGERDHMALLTMHHIASDAWSMGVLMRELATLYGARMAGRPSPLLDPAVQYADFASWQRRWLSGTVLESELGYWRQRLEGAPVLDLPIDRPRPAVQTFAGETLPFALPAGLSSRLQRLSQGLGATLFMTLLPVFQTLLGRYAGLSEVSVGAPVAGRNRLQTEELIGCFVNTLVLRTDLSGDPGFADLVARVRELSLAAYAHQDLPFERVVQDLHPERDPSRSPLFQVMFSWQNTPLERIDVPGISLEPVTAAHGTAKFDLTLSMAEAGDRLAGALEYNRDLFDGATAARLIGHLETLFAGVAADPLARLSALPLLTPGERQQMLAEWNDTRAPHPLDRPIHELFELQAARTAEAPAVLFEGDGMTYRTLDRRSNQLAHRLRRLGVGPEVRVAVCLARGLDLAVAILGVLKAGGAYIPLDPAYPAERLRFMLEDSDVPVLLTQERLARALPS
ncbi:MAG TPA: condensation domain-containing protein, partial [Thermoanaerobaculia bacterium]|nr:condensation domain-containing protein [Thermoanaerobaculia bacterium]